MTQKNNSISHHSPSAVKPILIGAVIAFVLISIFLYGVASKPEWGAYWKVRPMLIVPFAGAMGGLVFYFMQRQNYTGARKVLAIIASLVIAVIGLWMGFVLGLDGTLWD